MVPPLQEPSEQPRALVKGEVCRVGMLQNSCGQHPEFQETTEYDVVATLALLFATSWDYTGIMENEMETTILLYRLILGLYGAT